MSPRESPHASFCPKAAEHGYRLRVLKLDHGTLETSCKTLTGLGFSDDVVTIVPGPFRSGLNLPGII